jgi:hypothetical protein
MFLVAVYASIVAGMTNFSRNEVGIGFSAKASEAEYKAAEKAISAFFGGKLKSCTRKGFWVVADVKDLSVSDRAGFIKHVNATSKSVLPNMQVIGPSL